MKVVLNTIIPNHENMSVYMVYYIQYIYICTYIKDESGIKHHNP